MKKDELQILTDKPIAIENCKISRTMLGFEDHGIMTLLLTCEGDGWGIGFGGYRMDGPAGMECLKQLLVTLDVETYEELNGKFVRLATAGVAGRAVAIGHLLKDQWFSFSRFFDTAGQKF